MQTVVGVAIIRDGAVLAAQRAAPADLAGRWEFPGGKVAPGESPHEAGRREIAEELGCTVNVLERLGSSPISDELVLEVYVAQLIDGEPTALEHSRLRWLSPEELYDVDWLEPDLPFLAEVERRLLDGVTLEGGNVGGAVRIGGTVRRPTGHWTPSVHALLDHLAGSGLPHIPAVKGFDACDREILTYLPGHVIDVDTEALSELQLASAARWLAQFHRAVRDFQPGDARWRFTSDPLQDGQIVCHNDVAPYNMAFDGEALSGVFDWDVAGPGDPLNDVAFFAWNAIPLFRPIEPDVAAERLKVLCQAYGGYDVHTILHAVVLRMRTATDRIEAGQRAGDPGMLNLGKVGEPARTRARIDALEAALRQIERAIDSE